MIFAKFNNFIFTGYETVRKASPQVRSSQGFETRKRLSDHKKTEEKTDEPLL